MGTRSVLGIFYEYLERTRFLCVIGVYSVSCYSKLMLKFDNKSYMPSVATLRKAFSPLTALPVRVQVNMAILRHFNLIHNRNKASLYILHVL